MFDILKKKFSKIVESVSKKIEKKKEIKPKVEKFLETVEKEVEKKPVEKIVEETKSKLEEIPEIKKEVEGFVKEIEEKPKEKKSFFKKLKEKIAKKVLEKKLTEEDFLSILNKLEIDLIEADVAVEVAEKIKNDLKESLISKEIKRGEEKEVVVNALKQGLLDVLSVPEINLKEIVQKKKPTTLLFLGFNGSGKTTSLAKLGKWLIDNGYSCVFAASDTFRAAAEEQLEEHAKKIGVKVIKHKYGADPAAVAFDAIAHAKANGIDFALIDTAGRAHTNRNLMEQMQKIIRVNKPDLKILVIDSLTGNDAVLQAKMFNEVGIDGVIFTKIDVNEKGGAILSVTYELKKPILFLSLGQKYQEFERFNEEKFIETLLK